MPDDETVNVRYMVDDVAGGHRLLHERARLRGAHNAAPAFADVQARQPATAALGPDRAPPVAPMADGERRSPAVGTGSTSIVDDLDGEMERLGTTGATFRNDVVEGPGGKQVLLLDPVRQRRRAVPAGGVGPCVT